MKRFYTYVIRDPRPNHLGVPRYVGKGQNHRARSHFNISKLQNSNFKWFMSECQKLGLEPKLEIVARFSSEKLAFKLEIELIAKYGRLDFCTGTLYNRTDGGDGVSGSIKVAERAREMMTRLRADPEAAKINAEMSSIRMRKINALPRPERWRRNQSKAARACLASLHCDPKFAKAHSERSSERMKRLHRDPIFAKAASKRSSKTMLRLRKDPKFNKIQSKAASDQAQRLNSNPEIRKRSVATRKARGWFLAARRDPAFAIEEAAAE